MTSGEEPPLACKPDFAKWWKSPNKRRKNRDKKILRWLQVTKHTSTVAYCDKIPNN